MIHLLSISHSRMVPIISNVQLVVLNTYLLREGQPIYQMILKSILYLICERNW